ncbi:MAG TPA: hypothetical protein VLL98_03090 [Rickettsiales bacterium]|nr:hypothetical protein [Rickettsiales bacterium]
MNNEFLNVLENVSKEKETISIFEKIAKELFYNYSIVSQGKNIYRFQEIEFYLYSNKHKDETSHRNERQRKFGEWYVHRFSKLEKSKYSTFSSKVGLDLCLGNDNIYFAILIRGIVKDNLISGPIKVLNELYGKDNRFIIGSKNYDNYIEYSKKIESKNIFEENEFLYLKKSKTKEEKIAFKIRTGLNSKKYNDFGIRNYKAISVCKIIILFYYLAMQLIL